MNGWECGAYGTSIHGIMNTIRMVTAPSPCSVDTVHIVAVAYRNLKKHTAVLYSLLYNKMMKGKQRVYIYSGELID